MNKREIAEKFLATGQSLFVHLDPRKSDVPMHFKKNGTIVLHYGLNMPKPIHDLFVSNDGISGTLSFLSLGNVETFVPWEAVQAMTDDSGIGYVWDHSVLEKKATKNGLRLIQGGKSKTPPPTEPTAA
jgi:predicted methyltransferase MtxX (methanogen marker protein 4)